MIQQQQYQIKKDQWVSSPTEPDLVFANYDRWELLTMFSMNSRYGSNKQGNSYLG